jgi:hypothetical protein
MSEPPIFVVGVARSGTTLLRWMLTEHPRIAIPVESHFIVDLAPAREDWGPRRQEEVLARLLADPKYHRPWMVEADLRAALEQRRPAGYAEFVDVVYRLYADTQGKPRWGDKTPWYVRHVDLLADLFGDAVFVHIVRDGREVAASLIEAGWSRGPIASAARYWRRGVTSARASGSRLGPQRYFELHLADLIAEPEATLRRVCAAIGEDYTPRMLGYPRRAPEMASWAPRYQRWLRHLAKPPTPGLRDWRAGLSPADRAEVEAICRPLVDELESERRFAAAAEATPAPPPAAAADARPGRGRRPGRSAGRGSA